MKFSFDLVDWRKIMDDDFTWEDIYYEECHPEWDENGELLGDDEDEE